MKNTKYNLGVFLSGGGNMVFFVHGILKVLKKNDVKIDYLVGLSASSGMMLGHVFNCEDFVFDIFSNRIHKNKKNFYFFRKKHFPHNEIYKNSLLELFSKHGNSKRKYDFSVIASQMPKRYSKLKANFSFICLFLKYYYGINLMKIFRKICGISKLIISSKDNLKTSDLVNVIMGSSTIYPFIDLYYFNDKLLLDADFLELDYKDYLKNCKKGIIIYTTQNGKSYIKDNVLHLFPKEKLDFNVLDYTSKEKLVELREEGFKCGEENLKLIKRFLDN
jgi:hypothetical protein